MLCMTLAAVVGGAGWFVHARWTDTPEARQQRREAAILRQCQNALRSLARFGDSDRPGHADGVVENGLVSFAWPPGSFWFLTGTGERQAQSAACTARLDTQTIIFLQLRDRVVVDDR